MGLDQILFNNMLLNNALSNMNTGMKMPGMFPGQNQGMVGYNNVPNVPNVAGKGLSMPGMSSNPQQQQADLLNLLSNPLAGLAGLGNISALAGLQNPIGQANQAQNLMSSGQGQTTGKIGFTSIQQPNPPANSQSQQTQNNLAMFQQLAIYK
jgi:hypothetical protein